MAGASWKLHRVLAFFKQSLVKQQLGARKVRVAFAREEILGAEGNRLDISQRESGPDMFSFHEAKQRSIRLKGGLNLFLLFLAMFRLPILPKGDADECNGT